MNAQICDISAYTVIIIMIGLLLWYKSYFLDELPEFNRSALEVLRQPLEDRTIVISRAKYRIEYPASFMLLASMNPCPCGYYNHPTKECHCTPTMIERYLGRVSGPLMDRFDLQCEILPVGFEDISSE